MVDVVIEFPQKRQLPRQLREQIVPLSLGEPSVAVDQRHEVEQHQQPRSDRHRADQTQVQEQLVEMIPAAEIKDEEEASDHHGPRCHERAQPRDARIGRRLVQLIEEGGNRRNKE